MTCGYQGQVDSDRFLRVLGSVVQGTLKLPAGNPFSIDPEGVEAV